MAYYKDLFSDETKLTLAIERILPDIVTTAQQTVGHLEHDYRRARRWSNVLLCSFVLLLIIFLVLLQFSNPLTLISLPDSPTIWQLTMVIWSFFGVILVPTIVIKSFLNRNSKIINEFNTALNTVVFQAVFSLFHLEAKIIHRSEVKAKPWWLQFGPATLPVEVQQASEIFKQSELITDYDAFVFDTIFTVNHATGPMYFAELKASKWEGNGKSRHLKEIFSGYFVSVSLNRVLDAKTFITADDDRSGFAKDRSLFTSNAVKSVSPTILEWNEFEDLLHVMTTNEVEARYILTPNFMSTLHDWWRQHPGKIRLSFKESHLYILFPDMRIRFGETVPKIEAKALREYLLSISRPLLHVLQLVDEVRI